MTEPGRGSTWAWETIRGPAGDLVAAEVPDPAHRLVRVYEPEAPVFVLGSTQTDPGPGGTQPTVRRRSGGGGVLVVPGRLVWLDIVVPRDDPWWEDDVGRAAYPIGRAWATAFRSVGLTGEIHSGPLMVTRWSRFLCFAGLGPGEVLVGDRKVLGLAQRRTRAGACFQCAVPLDTPARSSVEAAGLSGAAADAATAELQRRSAAVGCSYGQLLDALGDSLGP